MALNKQISPVIRISQGERDASARATHLEAASEKYSETTIERKQMSTTTNFKRIALVAVASLGLGVLSSVPAQATINADSVTLSATTAAQTTTETYTATSAVVTVDFFGAIGDSVTLTAALTKAPTGSVALPILRLIETSSAVIDSGIALTADGTAAVDPWNGMNRVAADGLNNVKDSSVVIANRAIRIAALSSTARTTAKYAVYLVTPGTNTNTAAPTVAGAYEIKLTPAAVGVGPLVGATAQTLTINVTASTAQSTTLSATNTKIWMQSGDTDAKLAVQDSTIVGLSTANGLAAGNVANIWINARNASNVAFAKLESVTATITGAGTLGANPTVASAIAAGRSILINPLTDYIAVFPDGNSGVGTITFTGSTSGVALGTKTVTFSGVTLKKFAAPTIAATDSTVINATGANTTTVSVLAQDDAGNLVSDLLPGTASTSDFFAFSSDTTVATVAYSTYSATTGYAFTVTGVAVGTATITFGNASTLAASTIKSTASAAIRVGSGTPSDVKVTLDKATYAPGEKMTLTVAILDSTAKNVTGNVSYANIFTTAGITANMTLASGTLPITSPIADYSNTTNTKTYTLYAPVTGGTITFSYTGGTALATANQVARTVSATVTDSGAANAAAIASLQTAVASLRTLLVTLTNLVLKIQKKVRA
jgi:hypothetical protein